MAPRRSLEETRTLILDAGVELLADAGYAIESADLSLIDACRRAGLGTAGSGYKIWSTQQAFRTDVLRHMLVQGGSTMFRVDRLVAAFEASADDLDKTSLIRVTSNENATATIGSAEFARYVAVWNAAGNDPQLRTDLVDTQREQFAEIADLYRGLLDLFDREMVPPYTVDHLLRAMAAQAEGMALSFAYDDELDVTDIQRPTGPDGEMERWHLYACVVEAVIDRFTRPRQPE